MQKSRHQNFWNYYIKKISPKLQQIDILLKTETHNISTKTTSLLLGIEENEIRKIMLAKNISQITSTNFFTIVLNGNSYICDIIQREFLLNSPENYTASDISYIYNLDYSNIEKAFTFLNIETVSSNYLKSIFIQIPYSE